MPSTYLSLNVHLVFSTKNRQPFLKDEVLPRMHAYLGGTINSLKAVPVKIGGIDDHVHLLVGLRGNHCVADVVREVKKVSNAWMREEMGYREFAWQEGYAAFSVSPERMNGVAKYIERQAEHHQTQSYIDELIELLTFAKIEFDPGIWTDAPRPLQGQTNRFKPRGLRHPG